MARAVKTATDLDKPRTLEKLEIERRYWLEQDVDWGIVTELDIPQVVVRNIAWVHGYGALSHLSQPYPGYFEELAARVLHELPARPSSSLRKFCADMDEGFSIERGTTLMLVRHLLARKKVRFRMDEPLDDSVPVERFLIPGIERLRSAV
ncbi:heteromeric transposase endonuclease subunit TnsA [Rhodomicrobium vannielii ATCC 17100]|uniref:TnsA endonuclease C-terminal domain-containing protein n=1 Tax=Rhodomicrobium vannielii TaxID=1069 RepID=UPI00191910A4|nr:TnsA endonuclease C-terminal domain-containing protein [Rhodomicrobium vannielii]MBJ7533033.1 heteromeric transposase endonuclease subunit TnsA [Rhodomicrobium vannielii ATCC 17100]